MKTIYYYQSFVGLEKALENITDIDVIIVSSLHFGKDGKQPYIHLNDNDPNNSIFDMHIVYYLVILISIIHY